MTIAALLVFHALAKEANAEWKILGSQKEASPNELVAHWRTTVENREADQRAELHLAAFETHQATLRIIDQQNNAYRNLAAVMEENHCLAGVNGGYFDPERAPVGLLVCDGRQISPLRKAHLISGVLSATVRRIDIVRAAHFSNKEKVFAGVQCGPFLVEDAYVVAGLNDSEPARRTFAAVDGKGRVALGISSAVTLAQLGKILCLTNIAGEMKIARALNLDGGSSSAFWFRGKERIFSFPEEKTVRDFVAVVPRAGR